MGGAKIYAARSSADAAGGQAKTEQGEADQALGEKVQKKPFQANPAASKSEDVPRGKAGEAKKRTSRTGAAGARGFLHGFTAPRGGPKPGRSEKGQEKPWQANPAASKIEKVSRGRAGEAKKTYTALQCRRSCRSFSMFCRARRRAQNRAAAEKTHERRRAQNWNRHPKQGQRGLITEPRVARPIRSRARRATFRIFCFSHVRKHNGRKKQKILDEVTF